ncbi:MAG TPA: RidA family protein [Candidatus Binataceae bacterium]|nr:RidA family protein [Candidatus Binataceae bacterium]
MADISRISTNTPWEPVVAYSRLVKAGNLVAVSGTTATNEQGILVGKGQMYVQARQALSNIRTALQRVGVPMSNVIRTRMFVTDIGRFAEAARAHREFFADAPPATSMVEVSRLASPDMLIEIEADAYASTGGGGAPMPKAVPAKKPAPAKPAPKKSPAKKSGKKK